MLAQVFNLSNPQTAYKDIESPLKFQTRCVTCFPDSTGYLVRVHTIRLNPKAVLGAVYPSESGCIGFGMP